MPVTGPSMRTLATGGRTHVWGHALAGGGRGGGGGGRKVHVWNRGRGAGMCAAAPLARACFFSGWPAAGGAGRRIKAPPSWGASQGAAGSDCGSRPPGEEGREKGMGGNKHWGGARRWGARPAQKAAAAAARAAGVAAPGTGRLPAQYW